MPLHLVIAYARPDREGFLPPPGSLPNLTRLLSRLAPQAPVVQDDDSLTSPHEHALASLLDLPASDGHTPWAAWQRRHLGLTPSEGAWAEVTLAHWDVGMSQIRMPPPEELRLTSQESHAVFDAVHPLFVEAGIDLIWRDEICWHARSPIFAELACASLDRCMGRDITDWLSQGPGARQARRLQNEVQMLLHAHPVNQARQAAGHPAVNTIWFSGCGSLPPDATAQWPSGVRYDRTLRQAWLDGDRHAWLAGWRALDDGPIHKALAALSQKDTEIRVTLCGDHASRTWRSPENLWAAWRLRWHRSVEPAVFLAAL